MLKIEVDEAYAFDMLAVLEIKCCRSGTDAMNFAQFLDVIEQQLGVEPTRRIIHSAEYNQLVNANRVVFDMIEQICAGQKLDALAVHEANMGRFVGKKALQAKFFGVELTERKTATTLR
jgi:hypothetical protein